MTVTIASMIFEAPARYPSCPSHSPSAVYTETEGQTNEKCNSCKCLFTYLHIGLDVSSWTAPPHDPRQRCKTLKSLSPTHHQQFSIAGTRLTHDWCSLARKCKNARHAKIFCPATNHHPVTRWQGIHPDIFTLRTLEKIYLKVVLSLDWFFPTTCHHVVGTLSIFASFPNQICFISATNYFISPTICFISPTDCFISPKKFHFPNTILCHFAKTKIIMFQIKAVKFSFQSYFWIL